MTEWLILRIGVDSDLLNLFCDKQQLHMQQSWLDVDRLSTDFQFS